MHSAYSLQEYSECSLCKGVLALVVRRFKLNVTVQVLHRTRAQLVLRWPTGT